MVAKVAAGFGLYKLGKEAIEVASNITEVQNVVDTAFGDMAWKAERFAKNSIQQFGMSELSAKKDSINLYGHGFRYGARTRKSK